LKSRKLRTCCVISVDCKGPSGIIPFIPAGEYTFSVDGRFGESEGAVGEKMRTVSVEANTITEVAFR
jgi:hypothetical protein